MSITLNNSDIRIRPSSVDSFYGCAYQWGKVHLEGCNSIPNSRAAIGTAIHHGIEKSWEEAMKSGSAEHNLGMMADAAVENFNEAAKEGMNYGDSETTDTCKREVVSGISAWKEDIAQFLAIPSAVETFFKIDIEHPIVAELGGTIDYLVKTTKGYTIDDVKTSKRKVTTSGYTTQQSIYKYLAEANNHPIEYNRIQSVILKKQSEAQILSLEPDVDQAKRLVNGMLDALDVVNLDVAPIETILRPNPKHVFCSKRLCAFYDECPATPKPVKFKKEIKL